MPTATWSVATARPASADRSFGIGRATTARRTGSRRRSTPRKRWRRPDRDAGHRPMNTIALFCLVAVAFGGVVWVFVYPILSGERKAERRQETIAKAAPVTRAAAAARTNQKSRREQVEGSLRDLEARQAKAKSVPLALRISQAGLKWSKRQFFMICGILGILGFLVFFFVNGSLFVSLAMAFACGLGLPFWILKFLKKRREAKFIDGFPDAVDIIVRGIKAGLPLLDSLKVIAADA